MFIERTQPISFAYANDIPGSRCGPEDGPWPRSFQVLEELELWRELSALAKPQTRSVSTYSGPKRVDTLNFQPCPRTKTQDRYVVRQLDIYGRMWTLTGVFDGHLGDATVEHVSHHLPLIIQSHLRLAFRPNPCSPLPPSSVSSILTDAILSFDAAISSDVLSIFQGLSGLASYSDAEIRYTLNDQHAGGTNYHKARLCMYGTTALIALVDPEVENLWVANVGDCQALLVSPDPESDDWSVQVLTTTHNGDNPAEVARVRSEHPGEPECVIDGRVLGALAPTRCLGDISFKLPATFTRRVLYNLLPGFHDTSPWEEFLLRNLTPPYISAQPDVTHHVLSRSDPARKQYLVLHSDGLTEVVQDKGQMRIVSAWARQLASAPRPRAQSLPLPGSGGSHSDNMALRLLREALGGDDVAAVSTVLTLDMDTPWIDDIAIVVQQL